MARFLALLLIFLGSVAGASAQQAVYLRGTLPAYAATPTVNLGTIGSAATSANQVPPLAQGSTTSGQTGGLAMGAVTTSAPSYTTAQTSPLSLDLNGNLRVNSSASLLNDTTAGPTALGALNAAVSMAISGQEGIGMQLAVGTLIGTLTPEVSYDGGTTWVASQFYDPATLTSSATVVFGSANTVTTKSILTFGGTSNVRVRVSAYTSGTANATLRATQSITPPAATSIPGATMGSAPPSGMSSLMAGVEDSSGNTAHLRLLGANSTALTVASPPITSQGLTNFTVQSAATDNHQNVAGTGPHQVYHVSADNTSATVNWIRLYNAAAGFNGCASATNLVYQRAIPANTAGAGFNEDISGGISGFTNGIAICITGSSATTDITAGFASTGTTAIIVNIGYK